MSSYEDFLSNKKIVDVPTGITEIPEINHILFDYQKDIVRWALKRGRACIWADCGMGKSFMQLEWARVISEHTNGSVLILAPLAVTEQTIREGEKLGIAVERLVSDTFGQQGIFITNYEQYEKHKDYNWSGIVLDESSILKSYTGKYRTEIIDNSQYIPYRLACTATPAPNDIMELGNHSEFLGIMNRTEMLATFFVHDGGETQKWRLKGHAEKEYWAWVASWAVMITKPSDLGYSDDGFKLPKLNIEQITVNSDTPSDGFLFAMPAKTLQERQGARKATTLDRVKKCADMVNISTDTWLIWCNLNDESELLRKSIPGSVEVKGSDKDDFKKKALLDFANGDIRVLISKPKIAGLGMNFQVCHKMAFVGLSDSYEQYYQSVRRCWRFGQKNDVDAFIITSDLEGEVVRNIEHKEEVAKNMTMEMVSHMHKINEENIKGVGKEIMEYNENYEESETGEWKAYHGDTVEIHQKYIKDNSIDYSIFSPPFASLYTYSNSDRDMGNCRTRTEFYEHYKHLIKEQFRTLKPGRLLSFHCMNLPTSKTNDGYIGIHDFRGELIKMYEEEGFIYHSEVVIWKDPVIAMQRTKALGLLHKQIVKDSSMSRQGIPDYLVTMRKPGDNSEPISGEFDHYVGEDSEEVGKGRFSIDVWQRYASPVWMDINPSNTLQHRSARDEKDERHICPLQLDVIHRALQLWSNPGDTVLTPFGGIGSEGYEAIKMGRKAILVELKDSYFKQLTKNMEMAVSETKEGLLLDI